MRMRVIAAAVGAIGLAAAAFGQAPATQPGAAASGAFKTDAQKIGYAIGLQIGGKLHGVEVDSKALAAGVDDAASGAKPQMTPEELQATITLLEGKLQAQADKAAADSAKAGDTFLADNAKKPGVVTTPSGLQYKVNTSGKGKQPKATDTVSVNYKGSLISGQVFDESHGEPVTFPVNQVIPGWTEALQLMHEGDKWTLYIPAKLAYGENSPTPAIPPNSVLVFDVELVSVK
ncbi:MAG TPA: FKBP-type peptidyl-prolyl cis-trans isomerase [Phycisphaerae bacterium]|nr:FKBP-type peptidyl-prolyl cis-trans isomerase [Phycisphaerae bacterium]